MVKREMLLKDTSIFSSGSHYIQQSRTFCAISIYGIMSNIFAKLFWICTSGAVDVFKIFL